MGDTRRWIWVMTENQELGVEVLAESRGKNGVQFAKAEDMDSCDYHWHGTDDACFTQFYWVLEAFEALDCLVFWGLLYGQWNKEGIWRCGRHTFAAPWIDCI
jgi:hypothetical protein